MRQTIKLISLLPGALSARLRQGTARAPRFAGAFATREAAQASLPRAAHAGYDNAAIADVSFDWMCQRASFDYPLLYWLKALSAGGATVLDAGGHLGTKYIAFSDIWDMSQINWVVYDTPGIVSTARARQTAGQLPERLSFVDDLDDVPPCDILLASGLIQYLDQPFPDFLRKLPNRPAYILLNKVPLRAGDDLFTIERIGQARVPYYIRNEAAWRAQLSQVGYTVVDSWDIDSLQHRIATHPWLGVSVSKGYVLKRADS